MNGKFTSFDVNILEEHLANGSDYAFELRCLEVTSKRCPMPSHGGTYIDQLTAKPRQYDIRACKETTSRTVRFALECKNISPDRPMLIHCSPRQDREAFDCRMQSYHPMTLIEPIGEIGTLIKCSGTNSVYRAESENTYYKRGEPVGKCCELIGRRSNGGTIDASDSEIYDKWSQALSSSLDLVEQSRRFKKYGESTDMRTIIIPVVVVPSNLLWVVEYRGDGSISGGPKQVEECSYYVEYPCQFENEPTFTISHIHFVTFSGLDLFLAQKIDAWMSQAEV